MPRLSDEPSLMRFRTRWTAGRPICAEGSFGMSISWRPWALTGLASLATRYLTRVTTLLECARRVEVAHDAHELHLVDVPLLYESTFLTAVALFEALLEDVLV